ncbi:Acyl carrier protein [Methylomagnum ishizawai]|uniref:Acyl carrier protein n=1 Tax=Methylomagnum ishizawai TaxID=1760988 RepID=A0A1Y6D3L5_9GAMM|nr:acyl carrier protein [Methylomagnum ishizawai]SMF97191.1 Acyl carrier protein [Methylomagnum ishizawai]
MDKNTVIAQLAAHLQHSAPEQTGELTPDTPLLDDWFAHSMEVIQMVLFLEQRFGIKLGDADISADNFETLDALSDFVLAKLAG